VLLDLKLAATMPVFVSVREGADMRIHNLYADENGETHFRDIDIEMTEYGPDGSTGRYGRMPALSRPSLTRSKKSVFHGRPERTSAMVRSG
jgi:hypothetical protein